MGFGKISSISAIWGSGFGRFRAFLKRQVKEPERSERTEKFILKCLMMKHLNEFSIIVFMLSLQCSSNAFQWNKWIFYQAITIAIHEASMKQPTPDALSSFSSKTYFHPHCQSRRVAVKASSCTSLLYCVSASTLAHTLLFAFYEFQSICTWKAHSMSLWRFKGLHLLFHISQSQRANEVDLRTAIKLVNRWKLIRFFCWK